MLAMCIGAPGPGAAYLKRLTGEHLSSDRGRRALEWLQGHPVEPLDELPREDEELFAEVSRLVLMAEAEPPSGEQALELSWLVLERGRIERKIAALRRGEQEDPLQAVALHRERARLADAIASAGG